MVCGGISALHLIISVDSKCGRKISRGFMGSAVWMWRGVASLMNSLQELPLVFADPGVVDLLHQLGVLVDEPGFPQHICCCVLYLSPNNKTHADIVSNKLKTVTGVPTLAPLYSSFFWCFKEKGIFLLFLDLP